MSIAVTTTTLAEITLNASYGKNLNNTEELLIVGNISGLSADVLIMKTYVDIRDTAGTVSSVLRTKQPIMARNASSQVVTDQNYTRDADGLFNFIITIPKNAEKLYIDLSQSGASAIVLTLDVIDHDYSL